MKARRSMAESRIVDGASGCFGALPDSLAAAPQPVGPDGTGAGRQSGLMTSTIGRPGIFTIGGVR